MKQPKLVAEIASPRKMLDRIRALCDSQDVLPAIETMMIVLAAERSSITGRITDLRNEGYNISLENGRYIVKSRPVKQVAEPAPKTVVDMQELDELKDSIAQLRLENGKLRKAILAAQAILSECIAG